MSPTPAHTEEAVRPNSPLAVDSHAERTSRVPPWVPVDIRDQLDIDELARLDSRGEEERRRLERDLGAFVAAYQRGEHSQPHPLSGKRQLCALYQAAPLAPEQLRRLGEAEARVHGAVFVAYASPLRSSVGR
jgi:hypothetical protein